MAAPWPAPVSGAGSRPRDGEERDHAETPRSDRRSRRDHAAVAGKGCLDGRDRDPDQREGGEPARERRDEGHEHGEDGGRQEMAAVEIAGPRHDQRDQRLQPQDREGRGGEGGDAAGEDEAERDEGEREHAGEEMRSDEAAVAGRGQGVGGDRSVHERIERTLQDGGDVTDTQYRFPKNTAAEPLLMLLERSHGPRLGSVDARTRPPGILPGKWVDEPIGADSRQSRLRRGNRTVRNRQALRW